jgi:hypothetical protein
MIKGKTIEGAKISPGSSIVGDITGFTFNLDTPVPLVPED